MPAFLTSSFSVCERVWLVRAGTHISAHQTYKKEMRGDAPKVRRFSRIKEEEEEEEEQEEEDDDEEKKERKKDSKKEKKKKQRKKEGKEEEEGDGEGSGVIIFPKYH